MMGHKICFSEEIWPIIPKLSLLLLLIWSPDLSFESGKDKAAKGGRQAFPFICCAKIQ